MEGMLRDKRLLDIGLESKFSGRWKCSVVFIGEETSELQHIIRKKNDFKGYLYSGITVFPRGEKIVVAHSKKSVGYIEDTGNLEDYEVHWEGTRYNGMDMKSTSCAFFMDPMLPQIQYRRYTECILSEIDSSSSFVLVSDFSSKFSRNIHSILAEKLIRRDIPVSSIISMPDRDNSDFYESRDAIRSLKELSPIVIELHKSATLLSFKSKENSSYVQKEKMINAITETVKKVEEIMGGHNVF
ncbi:MAG: hypothetical protein ACYDAO_08585 [Thermoplasmataceae archaeon]